MNTVVVNLSIPVVGRYFTSREIPSDALRPIVVAPTGACPGYTAEQVTPSPKADVIRANRAVAINAVMRDVRAQLESAFGDLDIVAGAPSK